MSQPTTHVGPLHGVTVLDLTTTEAGLFCGALLADMDAVVTRLHEAGAREEESDLYLSEVLLRNRNAFTVEAVEVAFRSLLSNSHVLLTDEGSAVPVARSDALKVQPSLICCRISPFGEEGPWAERFGSDLVVQALSGFMELTGEPGRPPIRMGARVLPLMAGATAAIEIISCLRQQARCGGAVIDVSILDTALNTLTYVAPMYLTLGKLPARVGSGHATIYPYNAFKVADGYIVAAPFTGRFWRNFCQALGSPEWGTDPRFKDFQNRLDNRSILEPMLNARMLEKTRDEWLRILEAADVPCGPVNSVAEAVEMEVSRVRKLVSQMETSRGSVVRLLGFPIKITNSDGSVFEPQARRARPVEQVEESASTRMGTDSAAPARPLAGVRVLDLTRMAAGPYCTQMLADLGAEVIKVEEPKIGDPTRRNVPMIGELSSYFYAFNRGKKSIVLDMKTREGHRAVRRLMDEVDVVIENFRPGVMERLGLDFAAVSRRNKRLIFASISGFGQTGPLREKISFDLVNQALAGMMSITSEPGREPVRLGMAVGDLGGGLFACLGVVAALKQRERTGMGAHLDVSLHDVLVTLLGGVAQDYLSTGKSPGPRGSEHSRHVPERVFATADGWIAIEAWTDDGWRQLVATPGFEHLQQEGFVRHADRLQHRDEIHAALERVFTTRSTAGWFDSLHKPGLGIAPVSNVGAALDSDHVRARGLVVSNTLPDGSRGRTIGSAFRINHRPVMTESPPPRLGQHTSELICDVPEPARDAFK
jgi:crotonobetainyl-CoA:carnitine CoA-transferase CaiB-like acyl-CoA transferase